MAVSLLHNATQADQVKTADHLFDILETQGILERYSVEKPLAMSYLAPFYRREQLEQSAWRLLEILKHLPKAVQAEMALNIIQYIYQLDQLDAGAACRDDPFEAPLQGTSQTPS